jgi:regulator of sirC expression with transglutaminase-like and TPR domain
MGSSALDRFRTLVSRPDEAIDLADAALAIAAEQYPHLDPAHYRQMLDAMALEVSRAVSREARIEERIAAVSRFLFRERGFQGNDTEYYDARNSFLNDVLERRTGIPITLSVVYLEVGWRLGLPLQGLSFPGHFLVKCPVPRGTLVLDPFGGGNSVGIEDLKTRLTRVYGRAVTEDEVRTLILNTASRKDILARILRNLKAIHLNQSDFASALAAVERILVLRPDDPAELRDRGIIYQGLECFRAAQADLERYLQLAPHGADARKIRERLAWLGERVARLN